MNEMYSYSVCSQPNVNRSYIRIYTFPYRIQSH